MSNEAFEQTPRKRTVHPRWAQLNARTLGAGTTGEAKLARALSLFGQLYMGTRSRRTTIYLNSELFKAPRVKAVETSRPVSELVNDAVREALAQDAEDLKAFDERAGEPLIPYDQMVKRLKKHDRT